MAPGALQHNAVGVAAAAADKKTHSVHQRQRSTGDRRYASPRPRLPSSVRHHPDLPVFIQDCSVNAGVLLVAVLVLRRHVSVLAGLRAARRSWRVHHPGSWRALIPLIGEERLDILHDEPAGEALSFSSTPTTRSTQLTGRRSNGPKELQSLPA